MTPLIKKEQKEGERGGKRVGGKNKNEGDCDCTQSSPGPPLPYYYCNGPRFHICGFSVMLVVSLTLWS